MTRYRFRRADAYANAIIDQHRSMNIDEETRKTGLAAQSDAKSTAKPEAPGEDSVAGSPNQGTESR
jgi:hypothetical protein